MNKIKKLILLNLVLVLIICIIPEFKETIIEKTEEIKEIVVTNRSQNIKRKQIKSNLDISYDMNLLTKSNITEKELKKGFAGTNMAGLEKYFIQAEKETGINAIYLSGLACLESAWNTSNFAKTRNNLFGWQAYDSNLNATKRFKSKENCILFVANQIKKTYLTENGRYFNGYTMKDISKRYASDKKHSQKIYSQMKKIINKIQK